MRGRVAPARAWLALALAGLGACRHQDVQLLECWPDCEGGAPRDAGVAPGLDAGLDTGDATGEDARCAPTTCEAESYRCGPLADGCGTWLDCGACTFPDSCGGAAVPGACGHQTWFDVGASSFGLWSEPVAWGSGSGGGVSQALRGATQPALAFDAGDLPLVAWAQRWQDSPRATDIYARRFDGARWQELGAGAASGGGLSTTGAASDPVLALDAAGRPVVAWQQGSQFESQIYVRRLVDTEWQEMGAGSASGLGLSASAGVASQPTLAAGPGGALALAWADSASGARQIYLRRFDGDAWRELGAGSASGDGVSAGAGQAASPALAFDPDASPVLVWTTTAGDLLLARRYDGQAWVDMPAGSSAEPGIWSVQQTAEDPAVTVAMDGLVLVAWNHQTTGGMGWGGSVYLIAYDGVAWRELGAGSATGEGLNEGFNDVSGVALTLDPSGAPLLAWTERPSDAEAWAQARRFDGERWLLAGEGPAAPGRVNAISQGAGDACLARDRAGRPALAWSGHFSGAAQIFLRVLVDGRWHEYGAREGPGGLSDDPGASDLPRLELDGRGWPVVAWRDRAAGGDAVFVVRYDGAVWREVGAGSRSDGGISGATGPIIDLDLALDQGDRPVVTYIESAASSGPLRLLRFDAAAWNDLGRPPNQGGGSVSASHPCVRVDSRDRVVLAWQEALDLGWGVFVARHDGDAWSVLGDNLGAAESASGVTVLSVPDIAVDAQDRPVVAYVDAGVLDGLYVKRFEGGAWRSMGVGPVSAADTSPSSPSLALLSSGDPVVAWLDAAAQGAHLYLRAYDGAAWQELPAGSAAGAGAIAEGLVVAGPKLSVDAGERPAVAWVEEQAGTGQVYVRRHDGQAWVEVGTGSASGGGVSNSAAPSALGDLAAGGGLLCAVWSEAALPGAEIALRCAELEAR